MLNNGAIPDPLQNDPNQGNQGPNAFAGPPAGGNAAPPAGAGGAPAPNYNDPDVPAALALDAPRPPAAAVDFVTKINRAFANGPIVAGAVVDQDAFDGGKSGIWGVTLVNGEFDAESVGLHVFAALSWRCSPPATQACVGLAIVVATFPDLAEAGVIGQVAPSWYHDRPASGPLDADGRAAVESAYAELDIEECIRLGLGILIAAKVNWWKTNHHTGVGAPSGYFKKAVDIGKMCVAPFAEADLQALWRAAHWVDTRVSMHAFGIKDIRVADVAARAAQRVFRLSDDAALRVWSNPAGTAKFCDVWVGITEIESVPAYCVNGPILPEERKVYEDLYKSTLVGDPNLHMGSVYLCGEPRRKLPEWSTAVLAWVTNGLHAMNPDSTLLKAIVFQHQAASTTALRTIRAYLESAALLAADTASAQSFGYARGAQLRIEAKKGRKDRAQAE